MLKFQLTNIDWDTDDLDDDNEVDDLPPSLIVEVEEEDDVIDVASDLYGFNIKHADVEKVKDQ